MSTAENKIPDFLKAIGTVVAIFIATVAVAFAVELACIILVKISSKTKPELALWPILFTHLAGIIAAVLSIKSLRGYPVFSRALGGALAGFVGTSMAFYRSPSLSTRNLVVSVCLGAVISASLGKSDERGNISECSTPGA